MKHTNTCKKAWLVATLAAMLALLLALAVFAEVGTTESADGEAAVGLISYQVTEDVDGTFTLRLITGVDSLDYRYCGYRVRTTTKNENGNNVTTTLTGVDTRVYSSFFGGETEYIVSEISNYPYAFLTTIRGLATASDYIKLEIRPSVTTLEDETVYGEVIDLLYEGELDDEDRYPVLTASLKAEEETEFKTVLRFVATSDAHIKSATATQAKRLETIMAQLNEYFANEENNDGHAGVDALLVAGDVTNQIEDDEPTITFEELANKELADAKEYFDNLLAGTNTQLVITMGNHDWNAFNKPSQYDNTVAVKLFEEYFGEGSTTGMVKIGGYYFITLNNDDISSLPNQAFRGWGWGYSDERVAEYEAMIEAAIADTGTDKPIFVVRHTGDVGTVLGTDEFIAGASATSVKNLEALQSKYPNLVVLSGHSHYPIYDEFSIHQKNYTSLNTGTLGSSSQSRINGEKVNMTSSSAVTGVWLVEVDEIGRTRIRIWDGATNGFYGDPDTYTYMIESYQKDEFLYTEDRYSSEDIFFADDATLTVYDAFDTAASIAFYPVPEGSLMARAYEIVLSDTEGNVLETKYILPEYYVQKRDVPMLYSFANLMPATTYNVTVTAITPGYSVEIDHKDAFRSEPLTTSFTTDVSGSTVTGADLIDVVIYPDIRTVGRTSAQTLPVGVLGLPVYDYDETIGMNVVSLDGAAKNYLRFECNSISDTLVNGFTFEILVRVDEMPTTEDVALAGAMQSGGYGLFAYRDGTLRFRMVDNKLDDKGKNITRNITLGEYTVGEYYYIVATFDGTTCTGYLNGERIASVTLEEGFKLPTTETNRNLVIGADTNSGSAIQTPSKCTVGIVRLYSDTMTGEMVQENYTALNLPENEVPAPSETHLLELVIDASKKTAVDAAGHGLVQTTKGTPEYAYDETIGRDVVSVDGTETTFIHFTMQQITENLLDGDFTFETLVRVDAAPTTQNAALVSGLHGGGFGLFAKPNGKLEFHIYNNGNLQKIELSEYQVDAYYHVAAVYDGTECTIYVNGEEEVVYEMDAFTLHSTHPTYNNIMIGGDTYINSVSTFYNPSKCTVGVFCIYSEALTKTEVKAAYEAAIKK